jgi:hypothetical protein
MQAPYFLIVEGTSLLRTTTPSQRSSVFTPEATSVSLISRLLTRKV